MPSGCARWVHNAHGPLESARHPTHRPSPAQQTDSVPGAVHAWMPRSPCDAGCLPRDPLQVGAARRAWRWAALVGVGLLALGLGLVAMALPVLRTRVHRGTARWALRSCGVRLRVRGGSEWAATGHAVLVVAEHVSWLDALALPAVQPVSLVSRADVANWPLVGLAARRARTVFLQRERLRQLPAAVAEVAAALGSGRSIAMFGEGTTWCGTAHGGFDRPCSKRRSMRVCPRDRCPCATGCTTDRTLLLRLLLVASRSCPRSGECWACVG